MAQCSRAEGSNLATAIVFAIGPASGWPEITLQMLHAGTNIARLAVRMISRIKLPMWTAAVSPEEATC